MLYHLPLIFVKRRKQKLRGTKRAGLLLFRDVKVQIWKVRSLKRVVIFLLVSAVGFWVAGRIIPGIHYDGNFPTLITAAVIFGFVNALLKPLLSFLTAPLLLPTFGLVALAVNLILFFVTAGLVEGLRIDSIFAALWGSLLLSALHTLTAFFRR